MRRLLEKILSTKKESNLIADFMISIPRIVCGFLLTFDFGSSKFGLPWSDNDLDLFAIPQWFAEDVSNFGGLFALYPYLFAWLAAASEAIGGLFLMLGLGTRIASFMIGSTMLGAMFLQQWEHGMWNMLPAAGFLWVAMFYLVRGCGRLGLDFLIGNKLKNSRLLNKPFEGFNISSSLAKNASIILMICTSLSLQAQERNVTFKVDMNGLDVKNVGIVGSVSPLEWDKAMPLTDENNDNVYEVSINFNTSKRYTYFKFTNGDEIELVGSDNRILWFKDSTVEKEYAYNEFEYYKDEKRAEFTFSEDQMNEDIEVLGQALQSLHPAVFRFMDSLSFKEKLVLLKEDIKRNPNLTYSYMAISKFVAEIKCSHTFTNPWNQGGVTEKSIFHRPDKLPFTMSRIGKRLFIDKNASNNVNLISGLEVLKINGVAVDSILTTLANYVSSDGNNYEKKLDRLALTGDEKFSLFDIFYPLVFGSSTDFLLELKEYETKSISYETVKATSKTNRSKVLSERYANLKMSARDGWSFEVINDQVGLLKINSFVIHRNEFDWKTIIDDAIDQLNEKSIPNLIVDIRGNEGGQGEVGEYILQSVIKEKFTAPAMVSSVSYLQVPNSLKEHINTWDKFPYDFSKKVNGENGGKYYLKDKFSIPSKTYSPKPKGFKGQVYLLTDATNSSATHLMASYAKYINNITLVGQETGGNQLGTNGGYLFFLNLPNSGIVIDIPVINMFVPPVKGEAIDGGITPDYLVQRTWEGLVNKLDPEIQKVLMLIESGHSTE